MQKKFFIIDNDRLLNDLIQQQVLTVFEKKFNLKFFKGDNIDILNEFDEIDLIILNFIFIDDNYKFLTYLENKKKSKIIIIFNDGVNRSKLKKFSNHNFIVKPFKLKQLIDIIKDFFISYETQQTNIKIIVNGFFKVNLNSGA